MYDLVNFRTKEIMQSYDLVFTGEDAPWEIQMDPKEFKKKINIDYFSSAAPCLSKYLPLMPIQQPANFVSLRESATPLVKSKVLSYQLGIDLYFKVEGNNPTGSFKDRGSAVDLTVAREMGANGIVLASTGNMAASCSCYAAAAGLPCFVIVPEGVPMGKLAQVIAYGGKIVQVKGDYNDASSLAYRIAKHMGFYLAGDYAFRIEGQKTAAFEMIDQMLYQQPDQVVVPMGCGTNISAYSKGFNEYLQLGLMNYLPRLIGIQAYGANAIVKSYQQGASYIDPLAYVDTKASAIAIPNPVDGEKALDAIYKSNGHAEAVADTEMLEAQYLLSTQEGLFVEASSASSLAYLLKASKRNELKPGSKVVCVLCGEGLKDPNVVLNAAIQPPTIYPQESEFRYLYESKFFDNRTMIFIEQNEILFSEMPTREALKAQLKRVLGAHYEAHILEKIEVIMDKFLQKGKSITISDFQDIVQDAIETTETKQTSSFQVTDFQVSAKNNDVSRAYVAVEQSGKAYKAEYEGVGPVDAIIGALCEACPAEISFKLTDYNVKIRSEGVSAVVYVDMKIVKDGSSSFGKSTSPDIIQASVEAFEDAYNA